MKIENNSQYFLKKVRAKSKMFEYNVPLEEHISVEPDVLELLIIAISVIGDASNEIWEKHIQLEVCELNEHMKENLKFSSIYFEALINSKISSVEYSDYFYLLGAICFYLSNSIGSSKVMLSRISEEFYLSADNIVTILFYVLQDNFSELEALEIKGEYEKELEIILNLYLSFYDNDTNFESETLREFKEKLYSINNPREILLGDALIGILIKKQMNSAKNLLPKLSNTDVGDWNNILKQNKLKELWPSQITIGERGVYLGKSGVIQMPTSSGKTMSIGVIIHSAFINKRTRLAVIVAPYRSLCREITNDMIAFFSGENVTVNELSDIPEKEEVSFFEQRQDTNNLIVLTPEKLLFLIRNNSQILEELNLIIFDEAHMFDDSSRGTNYELLLSTIKYYLKNNSQKVLISAVISNAEQINEWLNEDSGVVVSDNKVRATQRSIGISDWFAKSGQLYFLNENNPEIDDFYVPKIFQIIEIEKIGKERNKRFFPDINLKTKNLNNPYDMSINYALKMISNGQVAIFSGTKDFADRLLTRILELSLRGVDISDFLLKNEKLENQRISNLIKENFGEQSNYFIGAQKGIFIHHGRVPLGIKLAIEHAMSKELINLVVCTSTLAQGVNLPIKYLIIPSIYQGQTKLKVRDFHNLLGRTGRAGKHIEGTVILSEPFIHSQKKNWKWQEYKRLLNIENSEETNSNLLLVVRKKIFSNDLPIDFWPVVKLKYSDPENFNFKIKNVKNSLKKRYPKITGEFNNAIDTVCKSLNDIENYVMFFLVNFDEKILKIITEQTLGYHLANETEKERIKELFEVIIEHIDLKSMDKLKNYSTISLGLHESIRLSNWGEENYETLNSFDNESEFLDYILPNILGFVDNRLLDRVKNEVVVNIAKLWIEGESYEKILLFCNEKKYTINKRNIEKKIELIDVIDLCDNVLSYETILPLNGVSNVISSIDDSSVSVGYFKNVQKKMRYGLPRNIDILIYETGFSDRVLAQGIARLLLKNNFVGIKLNKNNIRRVLKSNKIILENYLGEYPQYYLDLLNSI